MPARLYSERQLSLFKGARQRGAKRPAARERATHIAIADVLRVSLTKGWWWGHVPNGELREGRTGALLKRMGVKAGVADFLLISPTGTPHWLELKREGSSGGLSDAQAAFAAEMLSRGVPHSVCSGYKEAVEQLKRWGAVRVHL